VESVKCCRSLGEVDARVVRVWVEFKMDLKVGIRGIVVLGVR